MARPRIDKRWFLAVLASLGLALAVALGLVDQARDDAERARRQARYARKLAFNQEAQEWSRFRFRDPSTGTVPTSAKADEARLADLIIASSRAGLGATAAATPVWTSRGPFDVGGRTRDVALDVTDERIVLAASVTGGIWRSEDGGVSWQRTLRADQLQNVVSLAQDVRPGHTQVWYAGTGERISSGQGLGNGVYKSTDGGRTWALLPSTTTSSDWVWVHDVAVDSTNATEDEVYAATEAGVFRSVNGGSTWARVFAGAGTHNLEIDRNGVLYASYSMGAGGTNPVAAIFRSPDGLLWTRITPSGWPVLTNGVRIAAAPSAPNEVHFFTEADATCRLWKYTYVSGNGTGTGGIWRDRSAELPWYLGTYNGYCMALGVARNDPEDVFVGGQILVRWSPNAGLFHGAGNPAPHPDTHAFAFPRTMPGVVHVATDGGLYRADDGMLQFRPLNDGYVTTQFYGAGLNPAAPGDDAVVGGTQDNWSYYAGPGEPARAVQGSTFGSDGGFATILPDGDHILVETQGGAVVLRNIRTGAETQVNPFALTGPILFINPYVVDGWSMFYPDGGRLWRTLDVRSVNWTRLDATGLGNDAITALAVSVAAPAHRVYHGNMFGLVARVDDALGEAPVAVDITPPGARGSVVSSVSVDPEDGDRVVVTVSNYNVKSIFLSTDAGATWSEIGGNLDVTSGQIPGFEGPAVLASAILPRRDGSRLYFVGTSMGLFSTTTPAGSATTWTPEAWDVIGRMEVNQVTVRPSDGFVAVATHGAGLFSAFYSHEPVAVEPGAGAAVLDLAAPRPSPFTAETTVAFALPAPGRVRLEVFAPDGRRAALLADREFPAGQNALRWNAGGAPPGVYFVRLRYGAQVRSRRVVRVAGG